MTIKQIAAFLLFFYSVFSASTSWASEYSTDIEALNEVHKKIYLEARATLNDWSGEREKLEKASYLIDSMIGSEPNFLPIYIEKARLVMMRGFTNNNYVAGIREALKIIQDIQAKDPSYPKPYVLAGHVYTKLGDYENAERSLEAVKETATEDPWFYYNWAELLGIRGKISEALKYAEKALIRSRDNSKALVAAFEFIVRYSRHSSGSGASRNLASIVFSYFSKPSERLRVAERLIDEYSGRSENLTRAYEIIVRQNEETPNLPEAGLQMARLLLNHGYINTEDYIARYDRKIGAHAERILVKIRHEDTVRIRAFDLRVVLAIGVKDLKKPRRLIDQAESEGIISKEKILGKLAYLHFAEGRYEKSIALYERLGRKSNYILMAAYAVIGRVDKLHEFHKNQLVMAPKNAWVLGNYAGFLLVTLGHIDGAIEYGKRALAEMDYPVARNNLSLAYLIRASKLFKSGNVTAARKDYQSARSIGLNGSHLMKYCVKYCSDIKEMMAIFQAKNGEAEH